MRRLVDISPEEISEIVPSYKILNHSITDITGGVQFAIELELSKTTPGINPNWITEIPYEIGLFDILTERNIVANNNRLSEGYKARAEVLHNINTDTHMLILRYSNSFPEKAPKQLNS